MRKIKNQKLALAWKSTENGKEERKKENPELAQKNA